jgi:NitT/TauT family transport system substrate-binding protein
MKKSLWWIMIMLFLLLSGCSQDTAITADDAYEVVNLKMTISDNLSYAPIFIAEELGYFTKYGLDIEFVTFNKSSEAVALLSVGKIDVYAGTLNTGLINAIHEDGSMKVVADRGHTEPGACTYQAILIRKDLFENGTVSKPEDLRGLEFSASTAGPAAYLLSTYLAQGGLTFEDIEILDLQTVAEIDGYENKALDGSIAPEPDLTRLLNTGNVAIIATAEDVLGTFQSGVIAFGKNLLEESPDVGVRFLAAYLEGVRAYNQGKTEENVTIVSAAIGEDTESVMAFCWVPVREDGIIDFDSVNKFQVWSIQQGHLDEAIDEAQFWDPSFARAALALIQDNQ